jgi:predicted RNase H-like HicB family nuclease
VKDKEVEIEAQVHCEDGMYWAEVPTHPGLFASGETLDELTEALVEAWLLYAEESITSIEPAPTQPASAKKLKRAGRVDQLKLLIPA